MPASKVYFTDFRCRNGVSQLDKLRKLLEKSEFSQIDFDGKFVAIKLHFGELGNLSFLRANYAKVVADFIKERGGRPFITDCNTLYVGSRKNALEHMDTAYLNGYSPFSTGCHVIIADGLKGSDDIEVPVAGGEYCKTARIGRAVMDADIVISLAHFKGHEEAGFGGALKNIGMGCGSRAGKMAMHADGVLPRDPGVHEAVVRQQPFCRCLPESPVCRRLEKMADTILRWEPAPSADGNIKFFWKKLLYR